MRGIQYAAAVRFHRWRLWIPDHPLLRMMTRAKRVPPRYSSCRWRK